MKRFLMVALLAAVVACTKAETEEVAKPVNNGFNDKVSPTLVNPNATAEAQQLYQRLRSLYGQKTLSGVVANVDWNVKEAENVHEWTGK